MGSSATVTVDHGAFKALAADPAPAGGMNQETANIKALDGWNHAACTQRAGRVEQGCRRVKESIEQGFTIVDGLHRGAELVGRNHDPERIGSQTGEITNLVTDQAGYVLVEMAQEACLEKKPALSPRITLDSRPQDSIEHPLQDVGGSTIFEVKPIWWSCGLKWPGIHLPGGGEQVLFVRPQLDLPDKFRSGPQADVKGEAWLAGRCKVESVDHVPFPIGNGDFSFQGHGSCPPDDSTLARMADAFQGLIGGIEPG